MEAWSMGTAYAAFFFLAAATALGPLNVIRRRVNPVHSALRRDTGIIAGMTALVHTVLGLQVHMGGNLSRYFVPPSTASPRSTVFIASNYLGLFSALVLAVLVAISNNAAIRAFGLAAWKRVQRTAYFAVAAAVVHGLLYQLLEKRAWILVGGVVVVAALIAGLQVKGAITRRNIESHRYESSEA